MDDILEDCGFPTKNYSPSSDALVASVTVSAVKPTSTATSTGAASSASTTAGVGGISGAMSRSENGMCGIMMITCLGVVLGALML